MNNYDFQSKWVSLVKVVPEDRAEQNSTLMYRHRHRQKRFPIFVESDANRQLEDQPLMVLLDEFAKIKEE